MTGGTVAEELFTLVQRRRGYLELLSTAPSHKRDVIDELDDSRSTVDRAIETLADAGLVTRTDGGVWTTTTKGDVLVGAVTEATDCVATVADADGLLQYLPCEERVPPALFRDAVVDIADGPTPLAIAERVRETVTGADSIRGLAAADHGTGVKEDLFESTLADESFAFEYVFEASLVERFYPGEDIPWDRLLTSPNADITVFDGLPFGLMLTEHDGTTRLTLVVYDEQSVVRGQIQTQNPAAVSWGTEVLERYRDRGSPLESWIE